MKRALKYAVPLAALIAQGIDEPALADSLFLKLDGVDGEATDPAHKDEIDVLAWSWGVQNSTTTHIGGGGGAGVASFADLKVIKSLDSATPALIAASAAGTQFANAWIYVQDDTGKLPENYITIELDNVVVTKVALGARDTEVGVAETVTLNFSKVKMSYKEKKADGTFAAPVETCWDIAKAVGC